MPSCWDRFARGLTTTLTQNAPCGRGPASGRPRGSAYAPGCTCGFGWDRRDEARSCARRRSGAGCGGRAHPWGVHACARVRAGPGRSPVCCLPLAPGGALPSLLSLAGQALRAFLGAAPGPPPRACGPGACRLPAANPAPVIRPVHSRPVVFHPRRRPVVNDDAVQGRVVCVPRGKSCPGGCGESSGAVSCPCDIPRLLGLSLDKIGETCSSLFSATVTKQTVSQPPQARARAGTPSLPDRPSEGPQARGPGSVRAPPNP